MKSLFPWGLLNEQTFQGIDNINLTLQTNSQRVG